MRMEQVEDNGYWLKWQVNSDLISACCEGDVDRLKQLVEQDGAWPWFDTQLDGSAFKGTPEDTKLQITTGLDGVMTMTHYGPYKSDPGVCRLRARTPLCAALLAACLPAAQLLAARGAHVNQLIIGGCSDAVRCAVLSHDVDVLHWVLAQGALLQEPAPADCHAAFSAHPLYDAISQDDGEMVQALCTTLPALNHRLYGYGVTFLHAAASRGSGKAVRSLLASGADVGALSNNQDTPLMAAISSNTWGTKEVALALLDCLRDEAAASSSFSTARAAQHAPAAPSSTPPSRLPPTATPVPSVAGSLEAAASLAGALEAATLGAGRGSGRLALARLDVRAHVLRALAALATSPPPTSGLRASGNPSMVTKADADDALYVEVLQGVLACVIAGSSGSSSSSAGGSGGCDVSGALVAALVTPGSYGYTAMHSAGERNNWLFLRQVSRALAGNNAARAAAAAGTTCRPGTVQSPEVEGHAGDEGEASGATGGRGRRGVRSPGTPLGLACRWGCVDAAQVLLQALGASPDAPMCEDGAAGWVDLEAAAPPLLLALTPQGSNGSYLRHSPAGFNKSEGHMEDLVELLVAAGARVDVADAQGDTPLHRAALQHLPQAARALLGAGAQGGCPLNLAGQAPRDMPPLKRDGWNNRQTRTEEAFYAAMQGVHSWA